MITAYILIVCAAIFNALMDRVGDIVAFNKSIFQHRDIKFWCKETSWLHAATIGGYRVDAWHLAKSAMVICFSIAAICFKSTGHWYWDLLLIGLAWNLSFNLFYNKIFKQ